MNAWKRSGSGAQAHWIKLFGGSNFTAACGVLIARSIAESVPTKQTAIASAPGKFIDLPREEFEVCPDCRQKAMVQA